MSTPARLINLMGMSLQPPKQIQQEALPRLESLPSFFKHLNTLKAGDKIDIHLNAMRILFPEAFACTIPSHEQVCRGIFAQSGVSIVFLEKPDKFPLEQRLECLNTLASILFPTALNHDQEKQLASSPSESITKLPEIVPSPKQGTQEIQTVPSSNESRLGKRKRDEIDKEKPTESIKKLPGTSQSPPSSLDKTFEKGMAFLDQLDALGS